MESSHFFNSNNNDRVYDATDFARYFGLLVSSGIFYTTTTNLQVTPSTGMDVSVSPGSAFINGYSYTLTDALTLSLATADGSRSRIDRVVLRLDMPGRAINMAVHTGTPAATPSPPALTRTSDIYEFSLSDILISAAAITISAGSITDTRTNPSVCGLCGSLISAVYA
jgi:hypothetical protein